MKLLKIFGIVAGIHVVALILIFANPGCSTLSKPRANPADTVIQSDPGPMVSVPNIASGPTPAPAHDAASTRFNAMDNGSPVMPAPISFNPDAPAVSSAGRYSPTRPGTPVAGALQAEPVSDVVPVTTYTVVRGDSLWSIAKRNGISVADLASANDMRASSTLQIGQKMIIPGKPPAFATTSAPTVKAEEAAPVSTPAPKSGAQSVRHVVKSGETLGAIARKYQVSVGEIATTNNITDPARIRPGQELVIPGWKAPAPKPATPATSPAPTVASPMDNPPATITDGPVIFTPPPVDRPLDEGLKPAAGEAPVIEVEDANAPPKN